MGVVACLVVVTFIGLILVVGNVVALLVFANLMVVSPANVVVPVVLVADSVVLVFISVVVDVCGLIVKIFEN